MSEKVGCGPTMLWLVRLSFCTWTAYVGVLLTPKLRLLREDEGVQGHHLVRSDLSTKLCPHSSHSSRQQSLAQKPSEKKAVSIRDTSRP